MKPAHILFPVFLVPPARYVNRAPCDREAPALTRESSMVHRFHRMDDGPGKRCEVTGARDNPMGESSPRSFHWMAGNDGGEKAFMSGVLGDEIEPIMT
jgi:hypothetical protein